MNTVKYWWKIKKKNKKTKGKINDKTMTITLYFFISL